jgi:hypothetical protein
MDDQKLQPATQPEQAEPNLNQKPPQQYNASDRPTSQPTINRPVLEVPDSVAKSLLEINAAQTSQKHKQKLPIGLIITIGVLVVLVILASILLDGANKSKGLGQSGTNTSNQSQSTSSQGSDSQINQDVNSCSNVSTAVSEC